jgi:integrase
MDESYVVERLKARFTDLASKVTRADVEGYLSERLKTIGPARHNLDLQVIRAIFGKGVEWGFCRRNPTEGIRRLKEPPGRVRFLTEDEKEKLLKACSSRLRQIVEIALNAGLRRGELLSLRWENVDLPNRMIRVERSKNGERRDVPMTEWVFEILKALPRRLDSTYLFANPDGSAPESVSTAWYNALEDSGVENFTFHDLRHTFASNLVMAGVDIRTVQVLLGHKRIEMTMRYAHLSPAHLKEAISALECSAPRTKQDQATQGGISWMVGLHQAAESKGFVGAGNGGRTRDIRASVRHAVKGLEGVGHILGHVADFLRNLRVSAGFESRRPDQKKPKKTKTLKT